MAALLGAAILFSTTADTAQPCDPSGWRTLLDERFEGGRIDPARWALISQHDFRSKTQDVVGRQSPGAPDAALRLRADTIGTDDRTVKRLGVVLLNALDLASATEVSFELDWNDQANGSYLAAGAYLAPERARESAESAATWIKIEYIGVPPGRNARALVALRHNRQLRLLHTEGWPDQQRTGRRIMRQRVRIVLDHGRLAVEENGIPLFESKGQVVDFSHAWLHLETSSHSNYPAREVFFDDVVVRQRCR